MEGNWRQIESHEQEMLVKGLPWNGYCCCYEIIVCPYGAIITL